MGGARGATEGLTASTARGSRDVRPLGPSSAGRYADAAEGRATHAGVRGSSVSDDEELRLCAEAVGSAVGATASWRCSARLARFRARRVWRPRRRACEADDGAALALALTSCSAGSRASDASARTDAVDFSSADGSIASAGRGRARGRGSSPLASPRTPKTTSDRRLRHRQYRQWGAQRSRGKTLPRRHLQAQQCLTSLEAPGSGRQ